MPWAIDWQDKAYIVTPWSLLTWQLVILFDTATVHMTKAE